MSKAGLGTASVRDGDIVVGAVAVVNAVGDVVEDDGTVIAGARAAPLAAPPADPRSATTIACVATNAALDKARTRSLAEAASAGLGRAIRPVHTMWDGDTVFALATGGVVVADDLVGRLAADVIAEACRRAVRAAADVPGVPARGRRTDLPQRDA